MALFFFYKNLTKIELLTKIDNNFEMWDGYIIVKNYDEEQDILKIGTVDENKSILYGKIINFNMKIEDVMSKISKIDECKFKNKNVKYTFTTINAIKSNGDICKTFIIY